MPGQTLAEFIEELQRAGELARVAAEVDADLEIAEITRRTTRNEGSALLFERVRGQRLPVVTNLLGNTSRVCRALGVDSLEQVEHRLMNQAAAPEASGWLDRLRGGAVRSGGMRTVKTGACQQVVRLGSDVDLGELPILRSWSGETAPAITAGLVVTTDPQNGDRHAAHLALAVVDRHQLGLFLGPDDPLEQQLDYCRRQRAALPVSVVLGGDPGYRCVSAVPLVARCDPWALAGALLDRPIELVKCRTQDEHVPADAELVIEGTIDPAAARREGVVLAGDAGYCAAPLAVPIMKVTAITNRANPIFPAQVVGPPPHEGTALGGLAERTLLLQLQTLLPDVVDLALPAAGGCRAIAFVGLRKRVPHQARQVAGTLWGLVPSVATKLLVVVDADVDVHDDAEVLSRVANNVHPPRDVFAQEGAGGWAEHASPVAGLAERMGIDATEKLPAEHPRAWPPAARTTDEMFAQVERRWAEYGLPQSGQ